MAALHGGWAGRRRRTKREMLRAGQSLRKRQREQAKALRDSTIVELHIDGWLAGDIAVGLTLSLSHVRNVLSAMAKD